jgi:putative endopeptidase
MKRSLLILTGIVALTACNPKTSNDEANNESDVKAFDVSNIDSAADICHDFYSWSIGNWIKENPVPSTESRWMSFSILAKQNEAKLQEILDEVASRENLKKGSDAQLIADLYKSSMDSAGIEATGMAPLELYFEKINAIESIEEYTAMLPDLMKIGAGGPLGLYVSADDKNSSENITTLYQTGLSLPDRDYYLKKDEKFSEIREKYLTHMEKIFELAGLDNGSAMAEDILQFETKLANITWAKVDLRDPNKTYNKKNLSDYNKTVKNFDLESIVTNYGIEGIDSFVVGQPSYVTAVDVLMSETEVSTIKNYATWRLIDAYASIINSAFEKQNFDFFSRTLRGTKEMKPKDERILRRINGLLGQPMGKLFVEKHFPESSKKYISEMIENLRLAYAESIDNLTWMSDETKKKAHEKLAAFTYKVGYPDVWKDYSTVEITADNLMQNVINIRLYNHNYMVSKIGKPVDKEEWHMTPQTVNAYYNSSNNEIVFPAGILQPPFFHPNYDDAINYGGIGGVIGHEFTHGFDDQGSKFDAVGNLQNWWTDEDRAAFETLTSKLADQYSSYEVIDGMSVNGNMTLGENIADLGGITLGFAALQKKLAGNEPDPIDGFTWQQRFFLGWANVWKGSILDEELKNRLITDYHSPARYRVIGPLSNSKEFKSAFDLNCTTGDMVKADSALIKIW